MTNDITSTRSSERDGIAVTDPIRLEVVAYDDEHEKVLRAQPFAPRLQQLISSGLSLSFEELMVLGMFTEQKSARPGWQNFRELRKRAPSRLAEMRDYFCAKGGRLGANFSPLDTGNHRTERIGVAISIATANQLLGTTDADWEKIEINGKKGMDFSLAATQYGFIQLESKGCISQDVAYKTPGVSKAMGQIRGKKIEKRQHANQGILLGTIAVIPTIGGTSGGSADARVYLLDPPIDVPDLDKDWVKLYSRLTYYRRVLSCLFQLNLNLALANRLETVRNPNIYRSMDGVPLVNARRDPLRMPTFSRSTSLLLQGRLFGRIIPVEGGLLFLGLDISLARMLIDQKFDEINTFRSRLTASRITVERQHITIDNLSQRELLLSGSFPRGERGTATASILVSGKIAVLPSGVAGGLLRIETSGTSNGIATMRTRSSPSSDGA